MYHESPKLKCSKCGSIQSESFKRDTVNGLDRGWENGVRCLSCAHEAITSTGSTNQNFFEKAQWFASDKTEPTF